MKINKPHYSYFIDAYRIYRVLPKYMQRGFWYIFTLQAVTAILESFTIVAISFFLTAVNSPETMRGGLFMRLVAPLLPTYWVERLQGDKTFVTAMCLILVLFITIKNLMTGFTISRTTLFSERLGLFISYETYRRYFSKNYFWHLSQESSAVLLRLNNRGALTGVATSLLQFFGYILCCAFMFISMFYYEPILTIVLAGVFTSVSLATYGAVKSKVDKAGQELNSITARENWSTNMATRGIREIIIYRKQNQFLKNIVSAIREEVPYKAFMAFSGMLPGWFLEVAGFFTIFAVMVVLAYLGRSMPDIIAAVSMLFLSSWRILPAISRCMGLTVNIRGLRPMAMTCLELLEGFMVGDPEKSIIPDPDFHFRRNVELRDVSFRYPDSPETCLNGINIQLIKGESVALIGPSGSGKSTLAMILAGLLEPDFGEMLVDGCFLTPERLESYRNRIGYVPQNPLLLPGTIADNVALSQWGEDYDREKVERVCRMAAMDFIDDDPRGLDFPIGDGGQGLSGGQAQRVSIARALFNDPEVLIFDEATSSLDFTNERHITDTINNLKGTITSIIIAHRMTSVENCDRIIRLAGGCIKETGSPTKVLPKYIAEENIWNSSGDNDDRLSREEVIGAYRFLLNRKPENDEVIEHFMRMNRSVVRRQFLTSEEFLHLTSKEALPKKEP